MTVIEFRPREKKTQTRPRDEAAELLWEVVHRAIHLIMTDEYRSRNPERLQDGEDDAVLEGIRYGALHVALVMANVETCVLNAYVVKQLDALEDEALIDEQIIANVALNVLQFMNNHSR